MGPAWLEPRIAYLHVPFCAHHCGYCDFAVAAGQDHLIELYLDALDLDLQSLGTLRPIESLFIGGGTPTYLSPDQLRRLLESINRWLPPTGRTGGVSPLLNSEWLPVQQGADTPRPPWEFSIESTPDSITAEKVAILAAGGVTRISVGVQSFHPHLLESLDRRHGVDQIGPAIDAVRGAGLDLSLDLIFAAPGGTLADWESDLRTALAFLPDHVSTYGLTYEKGTPLWKDRMAGRVRPVSEDDELVLYETAIDVLTGAGYEHYEISNFARPGKRCRHNERYWANEAYFGFGVGAARYVNGTRELNVRTTADYVKRVLAGESPTFQSETLSPSERAVETMAVQLRRCDGIHRAAFRTQTGFELDELLGSEFVVAIREGLLSDDGSRVSLTRTGKRVADGIVESLMKGRNPVALKSPQC
jgi:putative oxygen-independent coproporphyrinogen III oxidase